MSTRILVAEDSPTQASELVTLLEHDGYEVELAVDGGDGLKKVDAQLPDLIISDVIMPKVDGYQFCRQLKSRRDTAHIPFVLLTTQNTPIDIVTGLRAGADNFITKPYEHEILLERVRRILAQLRLHEAFGARIEMTVKVDNDDISVTADKQQIIELLFSTLEDYSRTHDQLEQSSRQLEKYAAKLEASNRELQDMTYGLSHDLQAPLRAIQGFSAQLADKHRGELGATGRDTLDRITNNTGRMARMIRDLLQLSRVGGADLHPTDVDMSTITQAIADELVALEPESRSIKIAIGPLGTVWADPDQMRHVLQNLIANAVKFTRRKPIAEIEIRADRLVGETCFSVRDNGAGFDMAYADRLFGLFQRLHSEDEFEGTGVGLSVVRRIVQRHGGRAWADAAPDQGATISFTIPDRDDHDPARNMPN